MNKSNSTYQTSYLTGALRSLTLYFGHGFYVGSTILPKAAFTSPLYLVLLS